MDSRAMEIVDQNQINVVLSHTASTASNTSRIVTMIQELSEAQTGIGNSFNLLAERTRCLV